MRRYVFLACVAGLSMSTSMAYAQNIGGGGPGGGRPVGGATAGGMSGGCRRPDTSTMQSTGTDLTTSLLNTSVASGMRRQSRSGYSPDAAQMMNGYRQPGNLQQQMNQIYAQEQQALASLAAEEQAADARKKEARAKWLAEKEDRLAAARAKRIARASKSKAKASAEFTSSK